MPDLTPAAWDFLADVARHLGLSWARVLRDEMALTKDERGTFIAELDKEPCLVPVLAPIGRDENTTRETDPPLKHQQEALL